MFVGFISLVQRLTPAQLQGRAYSAAATLVTVPQTISIATGAALISVTGYRPMLVAMATAVALAAAYLLTRPEHRHRSISASSRPAGASRTWRRLTRPADSGTPEAVLARLKRRMPVNGHG
jgi:predicted MFS family arabinose efflux permease